MEYREKIITNRLMVTIINWMRGTLVIFLHEVLDERKSIWNIHWWLPLVRYKMLKMNDVVWCDLEQPIIVVDDNFHHHSGTLISLHIRGVLVKISVLRIGIMFRNTFLSYDYTYVAKFSIFMRSNLRNMKYSLVDLVAT